MMDCLLRMHDGVRMRAACLTTGAVVFGTLGRSQVN